ncbi:MAG: metallophosphoesterase [Helicobacter sp.]|nr:metallophosphoesterase [Helicobacter sp.]
MHLKYAFDKPIEIKKNAIFIADSHHHSLYRNTLDDFLDSLMKIPQTQIFLMGDIFDFLVGGIKECLRDNQPTLQKLESLSKIHEIFYFEGNHDFILSKIPYFYNIHCIELAQQPVIFLLNNREVFLAHGDIFINQKYRFYTFLIRNTFLITLLAFLNRFISIYPQIIKHLKAKKIHYGLPNVKNFILQRIDCYQKKYPQKTNFDIIEGHFHLGEKMQNHQINYQGLTSFSCKKEYFIVEFQNNCLSLTKKEFLGDKF